MVPKILSSYFKNHTQRISEILSNSFKNQTQRVPEFLSDFFKDKIQWILEILSNSIPQKTKPKKSSRFFRLLQKQDAQVIPIFFQATYYKNWTRGTRDSFRLLQKQEPQEVPDILSNYIYTPKTKQEVTEIFCNYIPPDRNTRGARDSFRLLQKHYPKGVPEIFQTIILQKRKNSFKLLQKPETSGPRDSSKLNTSNTKHKAFP